MTITSLNPIEIYRGDQTIFDIYFGVDMTDTEVYFAVYPEFPAGSVEDDTGALLSKTIGSGIEWSDQVNGIAVLTITTADTNDWELLRDAMPLVYGLSIAYPADPMRAKYRGDFSVYYDVVRA